MPYMRYLLGTLFTFIAGKVVTLVAAGTGDNTLVTRHIYKVIANQARPHGAVVALDIEVALADTKKLTLTPLIITADVNTYNDGSQVVIETFDEIEILSDGGGSEVLHKEYNVDLSACKAFTAIRFTPDLDASGTDTASIAVIVSQGGFDKEIVPATYAVLNHPEADLQ